MSVQIIENYEVMIQNVNGGKEGGLTCDKKRVTCFILKMFVLYVVLLIITHFVLYFAIPCSNNALRNMMTLSCDQCEMPDEEF